MKDLTQDDTRPLCVASCERHQLDALREERDKLRASIAAIYYNALRDGADSATLYSIGQECRRAVPSLSTLTTPHTAP